jgi:hypothetical protein
MRALAPGLFPGSEFSPDEHFGHDTPWQGLKPKSLTLHYGPTKVTALIQSIGVSTPRNVAHSAQLGAPFVLTPSHFREGLSDQRAYDVFQVAETGGDAFYWRDFGGAEFYVLFYYHPAGIGVLL